MNRYCTIAAALLLCVAAPVRSSPAAEDVKPGEFIPAEPAQPAPEISFTDLDGKPVSLADFRAKPVLVNLWATWCQPCVREMPALASLQGKFSDGLTVLAISQDRGGAKSVQPFIEKLGIKNLTFYLDPKSDVGHAFKVRGLPTSILIDRQGELLGRVEGAAEWDSPKMLAILKPLLPPQKGAGLLNAAER